MKVAFFTLSHNSSMYYSLIEMFRDNGHEVTVLTPTYEGKSYIVAKDGIRILNFKSMPMLNIGIIRKGIANLLFPYFCMKGIKQYLKNEAFDLILMTTPPLGFYQPIKYLKRKNTRCIFYLILRDIHPEGAKFIGLDKIKPVYAYFRKIEKNLYQLADFIGCMSPKNISFIAEKNPTINIKKLRLLPNWEEVCKYEEADKNIRSKYNLGDKFIVLYGGNIGIPQNLRILLKLAERKKTLKDVIFLIIGKGTEKVKLMKQAKKMNLNNVCFMDFIPRDDYNNLMKLCDIGFISLHPKVPIPNIPSKTLGYFQAKLPILAVTDSITDYGKFMLDKSQSGLWSLATDFEKLCVNFDKLYYDPILRKQMGENGYNYFLKNFTTDKAYSEIITACKEYGNNNL